ncbi:diguanylate cyclase [Pseudomonas matsuisoli]|uniref:diguanylate cyclase n=1 Tax=Pseudomonas matsuisoli TaxID=1515666 RepID=A0A917PWY4_9PSED|nr:diguanylate cyclase [Pseudomonas matsuisoli]GGJ97769.1 diguanylate cyclase response regulator [Pseudomonas matsuisoli]
MKDSEGPDLDRLKQHFAQRVVHQARQVLDQWQYVQTTQWTTQTYTDLSEATTLLARYSTRFDQQEHLAIAHAIARRLVVIRENQGRLRSEDISALSQSMQQLSRTGLRQGDRPDQALQLSLRKPVYVGLADREQAERLCRQLNYFGVLALTCDDPQHFHRVMRERHPAVMVLETDFGGVGEGIRLAEDVQKGRERKLPVLFFSHEETDTPTRLAAARAGGEEFYTVTLDAASVLEKVEELTRIAHQEPLRVLIIDDSRAQALHTERVLNSGGIVTSTLLDPIGAMDALAAFQPDLIILDMYMPGCIGTELAKVIRQHERYVSVPIIYLSSEGDLDKQLDAMSEGGDDFLTKPIRPHHLIATVRTRGARARSLNARMVRDSLTGLYNHTHTLQLLEDACLRARRDALPLSFAMLDIDHFKRVNDTYGHPMGDRIIRSLALFLKQRLRKTDHIGRYGGEEFAIVMPYTRGEDALAVIEDIRQRFAAIKHPAQPQDLSCTFSCGIAQWSSGQGAAALASDADLSLYRAKHAGRNRVDYQPSNSHHMS